MKKELEKGKIELPTEYLNYLTGENFKQEITIFSDESDFTLYTLDQLSKSINIDGQKMLRINQLKGYVDTILDVMECSEREKNKYLQLSNCLSIGFENTRVLYIDNKDNTLHIFHPDGGDTEKIKTLTLNQLIQRK